jgi:HPt (histidine-containing phosphotransfer) domain-containing protein/two-component sensor histidine kinase
VRSKLFAGYAAAQALAIAIYFFVPAEHVAHTVWQVAVGWGSAVFVGVGVRRRRIASPLLFYLFGAAVLLNATGILVAAVLTNGSGAAPTGPSVADVFYLGMFPGFVGGMALLVRRRSVDADWATLVDTTIITTGLGLLSWVFIIRPQMAVPHVHVVNLAVVLAYPVGDLVVLAMMVRLVLGGGIRNGSFRLLVSCMLAFLGADIGWAVFGHLGREPSQSAARLLEMGSMAAFALVGASVLHTSVAEVAKPGARHEARLSPTLLAGLTVASLIAPAVLFTQAVRGTIRDGIAIALSSTVLFLLVVTRMAQLLRRLQERTRALAERNRAVRLVLDTVNEGLLRISADGWLAEERSAMIDRWFGGWSGRVAFVDYMARVDPLFARSFKLGHEALIEGVLPADLCLAQLPSRVRSQEREYKVAYLTVADGGREDGLLVVINDVTEQVQLAQQDAEQRELVAVLQSFTRDRVGFLTFFDEANHLVAQLAPGADDLVGRKRHLHTLKGNAALMSLDLVARLCHEAEDELDDLGSGGLLRTTRLSALLARWAALSEAFRGFAGERGRDVVELEPQDLERLGDEVRAGLAPGHILARFEGWRCEPVERALARLATNARALARRLGKGEIEVSIEGHGLRLDPKRWGPLWSEMIHIVRNAVDHGFESPEERRAAGKTTLPKLRISATLGGGRLAIEVTDDGRGIDWDAVRAAAVLRGLAVQSEKDLVAALLTAGVTTSTEVSVVSGRGIGLSAVSARVQELAGELEVETQRGAGTKWRLSFPASSLLPFEGVAGSGERTSPSGSAAA